ncbi:uncharacterized protein LOC119368615 [Triticum dicoccoides]|uniref:uncharacterized protein LOC119368615 n=1 Tax=Triticum dicoccoides TaxID=85692 RepID=UPI00162F0513|nr:uncharacterized protein LOC119368615 [Triticum dicoccoides]
MDGKNKMPGSVRLACGWALLNACAIALGHYQLPCQATSVLRYRCDELTDTKAAYFSALWIATLCCAGTQATAAALVLLLPRRPRCVHRVLAYAYLTVAVACGAGHCMYNGAILILRPAGVYFAVVRILFMVGDIIWTTALCLEGNSVCPRCRNEAGHLRN